MKLLNCISVIGSENLQEKNTVSSDYFINHFTPNSSNMAQLENINPVEISGDTDINTYVSELMHEFKPTKLQDSERSDPRDEFPLPNAKRSRILKSEGEDHLNVFSVPQNSENEDQPYVFSDPHKSDSEEKSSEFSEPSNSEVYKNPFKMLQHTVDLFSQLNEFLIPSSDPLLNSYIPVNTTYVPYESLEPSLLSEQFFSGYNNFINDRHLDFNFSHHDRTIQPPHSPHKSSSNTSNLPIQKLKYPPFDESKSLLHDLLTAPLKPKTPKNPSILHHLISSSNINSPNDEITILSHDKNKEKVNADETMIPNTTDVSVSGVKQISVIDSAVGKLVMSFVLPTNPLIQFGQFGQPCKTKKREECSICHKRFENKYKLKVHMNCHTGNRPFVCETCGDSFLRTTNLTAHRRIHNPKKYQCPLCDKLFAHNSDRVVHLVCQVCITVKHMMEPIADGWQCKECGEYLDEKTKLEKHVKKHKKSRSCPVCLLDFSHVREHQLVTHVKSYHPAWLKNLGL